MVAFSSLQELMDEYNKSSRRKTRAETQDLHLGATCKKCRVCPIAGRCYRYHLGSMLRIYTFEILINYYRCCFHQIFICGLLINDYDLVLLAIIFKEIVNNKIFNDHEFFVVDCFVVRFCSSTDVSFVQIIIFVITVLLLILTHNIPSSLDR